MTTFNFLEVVKPPCINDILSSTQVAATVRQLCVKQILQRCSSQFHGLMAEQRSHHVWMLLNGIQHVQHFQTLHKSVATQTPQQPFALSNVTNVSVLLLSLLAQKLSSTSGLTPCTSLVLLPPNCKSWRRQWLPFLLHMHVLHMFF